MGAVIAGVGGVVVGAGGVGAGSGRTGHRRRSGGHGDAAGTRRVEVDRRGGAGGGLVHGRGETDLADDLRGVPTLQVGVCGVDTGVDDRHDGAVALVPECVGAGGAITEPGVLRGHLHGAVDADRGDERGMTKDVDGCARGPEDGDGQDPAVADIGVAARRECAQQCADCRTGGRGAGRVGSGELGGQPHQHGRGRGIGELRVEIGVDVRARHCGGGLGRCRSGGGGRDVRRDGDRHRRGDEQSNDDCDGRPARKQEVTRRRDPVDSRHAERYPLWGRWPREETSILGKTSAPVTRSGQPNQPSTSTIVCVEPCRL